MELGEKMSYLQGLLDGLEIDRTTKEGKLLVQVIEVMREMSDTIDDLQSQVDELTELCDVLDEDLGEVEETLLDCCEKDHHHHHGHGHCCCHDEGDDDDDDFDYDDFDYDDENYEDFDYDDDDELYEVCCPICDETIVLDETMLDEGSIECPCCGELLEFDFLGDDDDDSEDEPENGEQEQ